MRKHGLSVLLIIVLVIIAAGCGKNESAQEADANTVKITNVETFTVEKTTFDEFIELPIVVNPNKSVNLGITGGGKITAISVDKGDAVRKGMTLLETDDDMINVMLTAANATLEYQTKELARSQKLLNDGTVTEAAFDAVKLQLAQAQSAVDQGNKALENAVLKAPFAGLVTTRNVELGDILAPGAPAFRIIDMTRVKIQAGIPERYVEDFKIGNVVTITIDAIPGRTFEGKINFISPEASPSVRTFLTEILVNNSDGALRAGSMGNARILQKVYEDAIMIPINAIIETQNGSIVFVLNDNSIVEARSIEAYSGDDLYVLVEGLIPGEKIISKGQYDLVNGETVNVTGEYSGFNGEGTL